MEELRKQVQGVQLGLCAWLATPRNKLLAISGAVVVVAIAVFTKAEHWPAWVQAVGSVVAIWMTGAAVRDAHRLQTEAEATNALAADVRTLQSIGMLVLQCRAQARTLRVLCGTGADLRIHTHPLIDLQRALQSIPLSQLPDSDAMTCVMGAIVQAQALVLSATDPQSFGMELHEAEPLVTKRLLEIESILRAALVRRNADLAPARFGVGDLQVQSLSSGLSASELRASLSEMATRS